MSCTILVETNMPEDHTVISSDKCNATQKALLETILDLYKWNKLYLTCQISLVSADFGLND